MFLCAAFFHFWEGGSHAVPQESWAADASDGTVALPSPQEETVGLSSKH